MEIDANAVIEELAQLVAQQAKQLAIQRVQLLALRAALEVKQALDAPADVPAEAVPQG